MSAMSKVGVQWEALPSKLEVDVRLIARAMADEALRILSAGGRLPKDSGEFVRSLRAFFKGGAIEVRPTGKRNEIIASVFAARGEALFDFKPDEIERIMRAAQAEVDRQARAGVMKLK
jgi:hypothetical protein